MIAGRESAAVFPERRNAMRADLTLVARGLFPSRAKAAEAIAAGLVQVDGRAIAKASETISAAAQIEAEAPYPWVSRGGVKLAAALDAFLIDPAGRLCVDVGASTGGFTDVLLARMALQVLAVDVGHGQLHPRIAGDARVVAMEGVDARKLAARDLRAPPSLIVVDASFISLTLILPQVLALAAIPADLIALVKPQFEGAKNRKGIVRDEVERIAALDRVTACIAAESWSVRGTMPSPIAGGDGNREWLLHATRS